MRRQEAAIGGRLWASSKNYLGKDKRFRLLFGVLLRASNTLLKNVSVILNEAKNLALAIGQNPMLGPDASLKFVALRMTNCDIYL